jgi:DNA-binding CsgD family transcriptional regulator
LLVPYLDVALRQVEAPTRQVAAPLAVTAEEERQAPLSEREAEVMAWVALGKTNAEIGNILNLSSFTIKNHMQRIFKKLDVFNRAQAVSVFKSGHGAS